MDYKVLRDTPGYTNYVVGVKKNSSGAISSAELKRYYSSIDAEIYFNGEWVEDISTIQWSIGQQTMPLFGYNSFIFDDVAQGSRLINGSFVIVFTKPTKVEKAIAEEGAYSASNESSFEKEEAFIISSSGIAAVSNTGTENKNPPHDCIWKHKFDIDIVCGEKENKTGVPVHIILKDCYITSSQSMRNKDGGVAEEAYQFIARDFITIE